MSDAFPTSASIPAPGARAAKICGILAIVCALTCVGIPVAIVLGIVALVQHGKAKRLAKTDPGTYTPVPATGFVTGLIGLLLPLVMLPFVGIVSAIAIPALLGQRGHARDTASLANMTGAVSDLVGEYDRLVELRTPPEAIPAALEARLRTKGADEKNPWDPKPRPQAGPAYAPSIPVVEAEGYEAAARQAKERATVKGLVVFVISLPDPSRGRPGYLAGAVRVERPVNGEVVATKVLALD